MGNLWDRVFVLCVGGPLEQIQAAVLVCQRTVRTVSRVWLILKPQQNCCGMCQLTGSSYVGDCWMSLKSRMNHFWSPMIQLVEPRVTMSHSFCFFPRVCLFLFLCKTIGTSRCSFFKSKPLTLGLRVFHEIFSQTQISSKIDHLDVASPRLTPRQEISLPTRLVLGAAFSRTVHRSP